MKKNLLLFLLCFPIFSWSQFKNIGVAKLSNKITLYEAPFPKDSFLINENRIALVIGVADYIDEDIHDLPNDEADADSISAALNKLGFAVIKLKNPTKKDMLDAQTALDSVFAKTHFTTELFYFSGHGAQWSSINYLLPSDFKLFSTSWSVAEKINHYNTYGVQLTDMLSTFSARNDLQKLAFIDACRTDFTAKGDPAALETYIQNSFTSSKKLEESGFCVLYANTNSLASSDGSTFHLSNSVFTHCILKNIFNPNMSLPSFIYEVGQLSIKNFNQTPYPVGIANPNFYFKKTTDKKQETVVKKAENQFFILDWKLKSPDNYHWDQGTHRIGETYFVDYVEINNISNLNDFSLKGSIEFYPGLTFFLGGDKKNNYEDAFYIKLQGVLNKKTLKKIPSTNNDYHVSDWYDLQLFIEEGVVKNQTLVPSITAKALKGSLKDWKEMIFSFKYSNGNIEYYLKGSDTTFQKGNIPAPQNIFQIKSDYKALTIRQEIINVIPSDLGFQWYYYSELHIRDIQATSQVNNGTELYKKVFLFNSCQFELVKDYMKDLITDNSFSNNYDKQTKTLLVERKIDLIKDYKIVPKENILFSFLSEVPDLNNFYDIDRTSILTIKLNHNDKFGSSKNSQVFFKRINANPNIDENYFEIPMYHYKDLRIYFTPKSICFYDGEVFQGSLDFNEELDPILLSFHTKKTIN